MRASPPTDEQRGCVRVMSLPPSRPKAVTPPSQREARGVPRLRARGTDSHASDVGHWLGMTEKKQGAGTVDGCRGGRPHAAAVCAYITGHRPLALPLGELSPQVTERAGMVMVCPLRPRCARLPLPEGEARDAHMAHQNVCRGGALSARNTMRKRRGDEGIAPYGRATRVRSYNVSPSGASRHLSYASPHNPVCTPRALASRRALGRLYTREALGLRPYEIVSIRRSYDYGAGDGAAEPNNVPAAGVV